MKLSGRCKNRILSLILTVLMVFSAISTVAFSFCVSETYAASDETVYLTGTPGEKRIQFVFKYGDAILATKIVHQGSILSVPGDPPPLNDGTAFDHWAVGAGTTDIMTYTDRMLSTTDIAELSLIGTKGQDNLYSIEVNAVFDTAYKVSVHQFEYEDTDNRNVFADVMYTHNIEGRDEVNLSDILFRIVSSESDIDLTGWETRDSEGNIETSYSKTDIICVEEDIELYPVLSSGSWVYYETLGAPLIPASFIVYGGTLYHEDIVIPEDSFFSGYEFDGWYRSYDDSVDLPEGETDGGIYADWRYSDRIEESEDIVDITENTVIYAKWVPGTAKYTVVHMVEGAQGTPGQGTYTRYSTETYTGTTGDIIPIPDTRIANYHIPGTDENYTGSDYSVNAYAENQKVVTINNDGSSVKYVYHNRNRYKVTFSGILTTGYVKWGQDASYWDPAKKVRNRTYDNNTGYRRWEVNSESFLSYGANAFGAMGYNDKASVTATERTVTFAHKVIEYHYYECIPGVDYSGKTRKTVTFGGVTRQLYLGYVNIWNSGTKTANKSNFDHGYYTGANGALTGWAFRDSNGIQKAATTHSATAHYGFTSTYNGTQYKCSYDKYIARAKRTLSFAGTEGAETSADLSSKSVYYDAPLAGYDPGFVKGETTRKYDGKESVFYGWFSTQEAAADPTADENVIDFSTAKMPSVNTTVYAGWVPKTYEITFNANGGTFPAGEGEEPSEILTQNVTEGSVLEKPEKPEREDYVFVGWFTDSDLTKQWNFESDTVHKNTVLYAKWEKGGEYTVSYYDAGCNEIEGYDRNKYYDGARVLVKEPYRKTYNNLPFLGWSTKYNSDSEMGDSGKIVKDIFSISEDISLYAVYAVEADDPDPPKLDLHTKSASAPDAISMDTTQQITTLKRSNDAVRLPASVSGYTSPDRYTQIGWNTKYDGSGIHFEENDVAGVESDSDLYAEWMRTPDLVLKKNVTGNLGDRTKNLEFTVTITGLTPSHTYTTTEAATDTGDSSTVAIDSVTVGTPDQTMTSVESDASGSVTMLVKMKDDDVFVLNSLDVGAEYSISEAASDHVAKYRITARGPLPTDANYGTDEPVIANESATNGNVSNLALATQTEEVDRGDGTVTVLFSNNRDLAVITGVPHLDEMLYGTVLLLIAAEYFVIRAILRRRYKDTDAE